MTTTPTATDAGNEDAVSIRPERPDRLLSAGETAELLGLSQRTLRHGAIDHEGPVFYRLVGQQVYRLSDVHVWLSAASSRCNQVNRSRAAR